MLTISIKRINSSLDVKGALGRGLDRVRKDPGGGSSLIYEERSMAGKASFCFGLEL